MKHRVWLGAISVSLMLALFSVWTVRRAEAGAQNSYPVTIDSTGRVAYGAMGTARNSTDLKQRIGCSHSVSGRSITINCNATDKDGNTASCSATDPGTGQYSGEMAALPLMNESAHIQFQWDANRTCTLIVVSDYSMVEPKQP